MPDPDYNPVAYAETVGLIKPEDARWVTDEARAKGVPVTDLGSDLAPVKAAWGKLKTADDFNALTDSGNDREVADWLVHGRNASIVQDQLSSLIEIRHWLKAGELPDPAGTLEAAGSYLKKSAKSAAAGLASVAALPITGVQLLAGVDDTLGGKIADYAGGVFQTERDEQADIAERSRLTGGNRVQLIAGQILGQLPEMLTTGFGSVAVAKGVVGAGMRGFFTARTAMSPTLSAMQVKNALRVSSAIQGGQEGGQNLVQRMADNADAGTTLIGLNDIAASLAVAATVLGSEALMGLKGEARLLGGGRVAGARRLASEVGGQVGQEAGEEAATQIINDLADGKSISWDEVGWSALAGGMGGGFFAAPAFIGALTSAGTPEAAHAARVLPHASALAASPVAAQNAQTMASAATAGAESKLATRLNQAELRDLLARSGAKGEQHFEMAALAEVATKMGKSTEVLIQELGGRVDAGMVSVPQANIVDALIRDPKAIGDLTAIAKASPGTPSLAEIATSYEELAKLKSAKVDPTLPDGTKDDTQELEDTLAKEFMAADAQAGGKRTEAMARAEAKIVAEKSRRDATIWNEHYALQGAATRVTPEEMWNRQGVSVEGGQAAIAGDTTLAQPTRASYDWSKRAIAIGKAADASTVHHELMHHFLWQHTEWAKDPNAPAIYKQTIESIGSEAGKAASKVAAVYAKASGTKVDTDKIIAASADMLNLNLNTDAGKAIHEWLANGYEQFLSEGKAPTKELRAVFLQIAKWFKKVYGNLVRNTTGVDVLTDTKLRDIFDGMLRAADRVVAAHMSDEAIKASGMSPDMASLLDSMKSEDIAKAQSKAKGKIEEQAKAADRADRKAALELSRDELSAYPVYKALAAIESNKLDATGLVNALRGTDLADLDVATLTQKDGQDPAVVAEKAGFASVSEMVAAMVKAEPLDVAAAKEADAMMALEVPLADRVADMMDSQEGKVVMAMAELYALRDVRRAAKQGATEAKTEAKAVAKEVKQATAEEKAAATAEARVKLKEQRLEFKAKAKQQADLAKMQKADLNTEAAKWTAWLKQDAYVTGEAAAQMESDPRTVTQLANAIPGMAAKVAKLVSKRRYQDAMNAMIDLQIATEMQKIAHQQTVASEKVKADAKFETKMDEGKASKAELQAAFRSKSIRDAQTLMAMAEREVARTPIDRLAVGYWSRLANAARRRREKAAVDGKPDAMMKATEEIAWAEAMEHEVQRTLAEQQADRSALNDGLTASSMASYAGAGRPTAIHRDGSVTVHTTWQDAQREVRNSGEGSRAVPGMDLTIPATLLKDLLSPSRFDNAAVAARGLLADSQGAALHPDFVNMMLRKQVQGPMPMGRNNPMHPSNWTLADWTTAVQQIEHLQRLVGTRPNVDAFVASESMSFVASIDTKRTPPTQRAESWTAVVGAVVASGSNLRTLIHGMGADAKRILYTEVFQAEEQKVTIQHQIAKIVTPANDAFTSAEAKKLKEKVKSHGIETTGEERLVRLLQLGTTTGRQRVISDLTARGVADPAAFIADLTKGITAKEVAWLEANWKANEAIYGHAESAIKSSGIPMAKKLPPVPYDVLVDGKIVSLTGGYAAVHYDGVAYDGNFLVGADLSGKLGSMDLGFNNERADQVEGQRLKLSFDDQFMAQLSKIRTAAFLPVQTKLNAILGDKNVKQKLVQHYGEDWFRNLTGHLNFVFNGLPKDDVSKAVQYMHAGQIISVFGGNLMTAIRQPFGIMSAMAHPDIGVRSTMSAAFQFITSPIQTAQAAAEKSATMRHRADSQDVDFAASGDVMGQQRLYRKWMRTLTVPMRRMQQIADVITWTARYNLKTAQGIAEGKPADVVADEARTSADDALFETQGSALRIEAARINQTVWGNTLTFAGKWTINNANFMARLAKDVGANKPEAKRKLAKAVLFGLVLSSAMQTAIGAAIQPEDKDEERELKDYAAKTGVDIVLSPLWFLRIFTPVAYAILGADKPAFFDAAGSIAGAPGVLATNATRTAMDLLDIRDDKFDTEKFIGHLVATGAIVLPGVPAVEMKRMIKAGMGEDMAGYEAWMIAAFGKDSTPMLRD